MKSVIRMLRAAGLVAAVLVLPCCRDQIGKGDRLRQVTVRISITSSQGEPNQACVSPSVSADGSLIAFQSDANNLTTGDNNALTDIFVRNRLNGTTENATRVVPVGQFPTWFPSHCTDPALSGDGRFLAFRSDGNYNSVGQPIYIRTHVFIWVLDRSTGNFKRGNAGAATDAPMTHPTLSDDGRYLAFASAATNLTPANPAGTVQVYITDFQNNTTTLVSRRFASATPSAGACSSPRISADGQFVTFSSGANDLVNPAPAPGGNVYRGTAAGGIVSLVSVAADDICYFPVVSGDGRYVSFMTYASFFPSAATPYIVRRDLVAGTWLLVTENCISDGTVIPDGSPFEMSADGGTFGHVALGPPGGIALNGMTQAFATDLAGGFQVASVHLNGSIAADDCREVAISGDGRWIVWSSASSNLVDGDGNGVRDIYARGPWK